MKNDSSEVFKMYCVYDEELDQEIDSFDNILDAQNLLDTLKEEGMTGVSIRSIPA